MIEPLPPGTRLFHVGPQKTGTTALQAAAATVRDELRAHGVLYPGKTVNHRLAVAALVGKRIGWKGDDDDSVIVPERSRWNALVDEVRSRPDLRAWFGHEYAAGAGKNEIQEVYDTFGDDLHVLITLRSVARMLPSIWQETNKVAGNRGTFDRWLEQAFDQGSRVHGIVRHRHDQAALVRRWADIVGVGRVTVIVLDPHDHDFLHHCVEGLLGLPPDLLAASATTDLDTNRSLTVPEVELFRQFNRRFRAANTTWAQYDVLGPRGGIARVLGYRAPAPGEAVLTMPDWAADAADELARRNAAGVAASGVRVIGNPELLALPARRRRSHEEDHRRVKQVPIDLAAEAMVGIAAAAVGLAPSLEEPQVGPNVVNPLSRFTARQLAAELYRRGRARMRR